MKQQTSPIRRVPALLAASMTAVVVCGCEREHERKEPLSYPEKEAPASLYHANTEDGMTLEAETASSVKKGGPMPMSVTLTNGRSALVSVAILGGAGELGIAIEDSQGRVVPPVREQPSFVRGGSMRMDNLKLGESYHWQVDLGKSYRLEPGDYKVSMSAFIYEYTHEPLTSDTIPLSGVRLHVTE